MKILNEKQGLEWVSSFGLKNVQEDELATVYKNFVQFLLPADSGVKTCLSRLICDIIKYEKEVCLWIIERGVFPSNENLDLFNGYRKYIGENRDVEDAPCHLISGGDSKILESLLALSLYFIWDVVVFDPTQKAAFCVSHDEVLSVYAKDRTKLEEIERILKNFNLKLV